MLMTATARRPKARVDLALHEVGREGLLYDREGELVHILNVTALEIWRHCDGEKDLEIIEAAVRARFSGVNGQDVRGDIERLIIQFGERGLLVGESSTKGVHPGGTQAAVRQRTDG